MDEVEEIKNRIDIVDVVRGYTTLKKAGINYKSVCPFHSEKSASFIVSPEKQIYKCFGCSAGGDVFDFIMRIENLEFVEALEMLADRAGVKLQKFKKNPEYQKIKNKKTTLYKINKISSLVFNKILKEHKLAGDAREYLKGRKITDKLISEFTIGYAPKKKVLGNFLISKGFSQKDISDAGSPDKFYNRVIFPIKDASGNVVGFTGRVLEKGVEPKYYNTPETRIFHKGYALYGLDLAKEYIKEKKQVIVVEGQMDVISSYGADVKNVVASSGTALTENHLKTLKRYTQNICFCFDNDTAGEKASEKAIKLAVQMGFSVKAIIIPKGYKDAGEVIEKDPELWKKIANESVFAIDWIINKEFKKYKNISSKDKKDIAKKILPIISIIPDKIEQNHYVKFFTRNLVGVSERIILESLSKIKNKNTVTRQEKSKERIKISDWEYFVGLLVSNPDLIGENISKIDYKEFEENSLIRKIYKALESCYTNEECNTDKKTCLTQSEVLVCIEKKVTEDEFKKFKLTLLVIEEEFKKDTKQEVSSNLKEILKKLKLNEKDKIKADFAKQISDAEKVKDIKKVKKLLEEFQNAIKKS